MTTVHTLTSKGQVTIPKAFRDKIGLLPGKQASIQLLDDRTIAIRTPLSAKKLRQLVGAPTHGQPLSPKEKERLQARGL